MTKKVASFLEGKTGVTPSVAAPADTNPSDATGCKYDVKIHREVHGKEMSKWVKRASCCSFFALFFSAFYSLFLLFLYHVIFYIGKPSFSLTRESAWILLLWRHWAVSYVSRQRLFRKLGQYVNHCFHQLYRLSSGDTTTHPRRWCARRASIPFR